MHTVYWEVVHSLSFLFSHYMPGHKPAGQQEEERSVISILILVLIASYTWVIILQFILYCGGSSVDTPGSVPSVSITLRNVRSVQRQVWCLAGTSRAMCLSHWTWLQTFYYQNIQTSPPSFYSYILPLLHWLSSRAPLHSGLSSTSDSARAALFESFKPHVKWQTLRGQFIQRGTLPGMNM